MFGSRRHTRYPINLRLRLQLPGGELETTTEDVSLAGFSAPCPQLPPEGSSFGFVVHLPDGAQVTGIASAMRVNDAGLAGFSAEFASDTAPAWEGFIKQEQGSGGLWRMLSRYASSTTSEQDAARAVVEKGRFEQVLKRESASAVRLHMVGENGEAYRVAFERSASEPPEQSAFASASPQLLELARRAVTRLLSEDLFLRRTPSTPIEPVRIAELKRGGYAYLVKGATGKPSLMGLHGSEMMVVEVDGQTVFPHFTADELERIAADTFRREEVATTTPAQPIVPVVQEERFSEKYQHRIVDNRPTPATEADLRAAMRASERVQTRTYGDRTLKLFPDLWVYVEPAESPRQPLRGFMLEDAPALCVFVLVGPNAPRVLRLDPGDFVGIIREA
ncbi:MAG: PilZ domain-containing protein [Myxococcaceae bacterium]